MWCKGHIVSEGLLVYILAVDCSVSVPSPNAVHYGTVYLVTRSWAVQEVCCVSEAFPQHPYRCGGPAGRVGSPLL